MNHSFTSRSQQRLFETVISALDRLGYTRERLLREHYQFSNHFSGSNETVTAAAAAFGQEPFDPNSACIAVALSNGHHGTGLINRYRALGAPFAIEVTNDRVIQWRVTPNVNDADKQEEINPDSLEELFERNRDRWSPSSILRYKNVAAPGERQLDFIDAGLLPALETHIRAKLDPLLRETIDLAKVDYNKRHNVEPNADRLFRLVFRALTGKVMHDRGLQPFASIDGITSPTEFLDAVAGHYNDPKPIIKDRSVQELVINKFWKGMSFAHLSTDVLAYVWENTLVSDDLRLSHGIHATPPNVARFLVQSLINDIPGATEYVVEPCCGSGTFLIAALQRLRALMPHEMRPTTRHKLFADCLRGFDIETFGLEVSQSCLTLADFPNKNGWFLKDEDVFGSERRSPRFSESLKNARFVICNPPFEDFAEDDPNRADAKFVQRPAELLHRVLNQTPANCEIGFVLPYAAVDGRTYSPLRERIADRFGRLEILQMPEGIFEKANFPTALVVCKEPKPAKSQSTLQYSMVTNAKDFVQWGKIDWTLKSSRSTDQLKSRFSIASLDHVWNSLSSCRTLGQAVSDICRGVEWEGFDLEKHISKEPLPGFLPGFHKAKHLRCFEPPPLSFLSPEDRRRNAWDKPWHLSKVVCPAIRKSQGPWKIAACAVDLNLICSQNFTVAWPAEPWTARSIAAVLSGPVACAFMASHEHWKHLKKGNLGRIPIPNLTQPEIQELDSLVAQFERIVRLKKDDLPKANSALDSTLQGLLFHIDCAVLRGYGLAANNLSDLLEIFKDAQRPAAVQYDVADLSLALSGRPHVPLPNEDDVWGIVERTLRDAGR